MGRPSRPVTVRGVTYPSVKVAALSLGVCESTVWRALARGTLDRIGMHAARHAPMPVKIRDDIYCHAGEAARAHGVGRSAIYQALYRGELDRIGLPRRGGGRARPFEIGGMRWHSLRAASLDLGMNGGYISLVLRRRSREGMERLLSAVMRLRAERERHAA